MQAPFKEQGGRYVGYECLMMLVQPRPRAVEDPMELLSQHSWVCDQVVNSEHYRRDEAGDLSAGTR